ncbi:MAG: DEAD/DEAH box helicase [Phycisphaerae bacterium]|nr:DEAD/DEAH box helicase [Phycisphaerae bacterium]
MPGVCEPCECAARLKEATIANQVLTTLTGSSERAEVGVVSEIRLTPTGHLCWESPEGQTDSVDVRALREVFSNDWREGLFTLAAEKTATGESLTLHYWQGVADRYVTALCHIPGSAEKIEVEPPSPAECATWVLTAPPMRGGEYLTTQVLLNVWSALDEWVAEAITSAGGLEAFLQARAPKWHQVGRVCFHLAENKNDQARPFAFLATYATGFGTGGRLKHLPLRKALEQYAGAKDRSALIKLLAPVQQAAERCEWVMKLVDSGEVYQPMTWTAKQAYALLRTAPELEDSGLSVRLPDWWRKRPRPQVSVTIGQAKKSTLGTGAVLDFDMKLALGDDTLSSEELAELLAGEDGLVLLKGQWVEVDREKLREALDHWQAMENRATNGEISFVEGMRLLAGASADLKHEDRAEEERPWLHVSAGDGMREILAGLREPGQLDAVELGDGLGDGLQATLRPYQRVGLAWLRFLTTLGLGACLADDMGLGKTIQVLALLLCDRDEQRTQPRRPSLLVVPASLLGNWRSEAKRFSPSLKLTFLHPAETDRRVLERIARSPEQRLRETDLAVTTYSMLTRQDWLTRMDWRLVILDEAQAIKNPSTRQSKAAKRLPAEARIVLTGTPVENRLGDLWSLFDFLNPGLLGSAGVFKTFVKGLQEQERNRFAPLRRLVGPYVLRRLKTDRSIIADLPEKIETTRYCNLTKKQIGLYEQTVRRMRSALENADGMARRGLVLQTLMRLKQVCNHPSQLSGDGDYSPSDSGKFLRLGEVCEELAQRQEKALIFTQFREIIPALADHLAAVFGRAGLVLHGGTSVKKRRGLIERFQHDDGPPFFILSLKAGGTGLNLTAASHVIHFDRWWNPAVENQATDRVFRIGQKRNVLVHKFVTSGTIEERIDELIAEKRHMADEILADDGEINLTELPDDELIRLVRLDVTRATM